MLSLFQKRVARMFFAIPEAEGFALAGGAALNVWKVVDRETRDLDFFGTFEREVAVVVERFKEVLGAQGLVFNVIRSTPSFARILVSDASSQDEVLVEIGCDYRIRNPVPSEVGPVLAFEELAADKLLALFGRAEARDFVDVYFLSGALGIDAMLRLALEKDSGFDRHVLATMIARLHQLPRNDFPVDDPTFQSLKRFYEELQAQLIDACLNG